MQGWMQLAAALVACLAGLLARHAAVASVAAAVPDALGLAHCLPAAQLPAADCPRPAKSSVCAGGCLGLCQNGQVWLGAQRAP